MIFIFLLILVVGLLLIGEYFRKEYPNSNFSKWWERNVISDVDDRFDI
jgi:Na+-transporting methylmalonyl-CoA/oxaloacetate decarboxylase gamma subunit